MEARQAAVDGPPEAQAAVCQAVMEALQAAAEVDGLEAQVDGKHRNTASISNVQTKNAISDFKLLPQTSRVFSLI